MASHEELVAELQKLEKLSHAARLKHAKKRRVKQLKKYQEWVRYDRQTSGTISSKRTPAKINFESSAVLTDLVARNDLIGVSKLCECGADPNISNADGLTPLHKCCIDNALEMAEVLLEHGVDLNARDIEGWTPLHAAAATGNVQMINMLIDEGASLVAINNDDKMPVDVAADGDIRYILQQKMIEAGYTDDVLEYIRISVPKTMLADLKDSVKNGRCLNVQDKYGTAALHIAASNGYTEVMEYLLAEEDVNLNITDNEGWTPFHAAVCWNQPETMRKLAEKGANMDLKNLRGETPYVIAEDPEIRQLILELKGQYSQNQEGNVDDDFDVEMIPRARRMSVKRISQQAKEELAKQSVHDEASLRRESMVQHDLQMSLQDKLEDKEVIADEIAGEDDEAAITLVRIMSISNAKAEASVRDSSPSEDSLTLQSLRNDTDPLLKPRLQSDSSDVSEDRPSSNGKASSQAKTKTTNIEKNNVNRYTVKGNRPVRTSVQEEPFNKSRVPRKSVLKHTNRPIPRVASTYDSTTPSSPPRSPSVYSSDAGSDGTRSPTPKSPHQQPGDKPCCTIM